MFSETLLVFLVVYFLSNFAHGQRCEKFFREDYSYIETTGGFYKIHTSRQTWSEAKRLCDLEGASFFYPDNRDEANAVISLWKSIQPNVPWAFVGMSDILSEGLFETVDGKSAFEVYNQWQQGEPNDLGGNEDCVHLNLQGNINDFPCDEKSYFICKRSPLLLEQNYHCNMSNLDGQKAKKFFRKDYHYIEAVESFYKLHTIPQTWAEAKRVCAQEGATFWHPENDNEAHELLSFWNKTKPKIEWVYVGLSDILVEGVFETVDGKSISDVYDNWQPGEPNNFDGVQDCVYIYLKEGPGYLDDYACDKKYSFFCKKRLQSLEWNYQCDMPFLDYTFNVDTGKCYKLHTTPLSWNEAHAVCRLEQSSLAIISNRLEAEYLVQLTESTPKSRVRGKYQRGIYHLGFYKRLNEDWQTVRGTPMKVDRYAWWDDYQPEADDREQCGAMFFNGRLININCEMRSFFICEHEVADKS